METYLGTKPSTIQSWSRGAIRAHFLELRKANPNASEKQLIVLFDDLIAEDRFVRRSATEYLAALFLHRLEDYEKKAEAREPLRGTAPTPEQQAERKAAIAEAAKSVSSRALELNREMPNGKRLRYCTGIETMAWGKGYAAIGKKAGPKLIGQVFDEVGVRRLLGL